MRKTITFSVKEKSQTLTFKITEMPASRFEKWINKLVLMLAKSAKGNPNIDQTFLSLGKKFYSASEKGGMVETTKMIFEFLQKNGISGLLEIIGNIDYDDFEPLYDDLLSCCKRVVGESEMDCSLSNLDGFVSEVATLYRLRGEILSLHFGFFTEGEASPTEEESSPEPKAKIKFGKNS